MNKSAAPLARLRRRGLDARRSLTAAERIEASRRIVDHTTRCNEFNAAETIACYLPMEDEVDPTQLIERAWRMGKRVCIPVIGPRRRMRFSRLDPETKLAQSSFGLFEPLEILPVPIKEIDLVITPLAAFDSCGHRIGMGGGYFDRNFAFLRRRRHWHRPKLLGVAFSCQRVSDFVPNAWDVPLYSIVTETARLRFFRYRRTS